MSDLPRFKITIHPEGGQVSLSISAHASDVIVAEMVHYVAMALELLSRPENAGKRWPTVEEVKAAAEEQRLLEAYPAERLYVKSGQQLWLSNAALEAGEGPVRGSPGQNEGLEEGDLRPLRELLADAGWTNAGPVPAGVKRVCDYAADPEGVLAILT